MGTTASASFNTIPTRANEVWTMDYTHDELAGGRKFRTLNLMDG